MRLFRFKRTSLHNFIRHRTDGTAGIEFALVLPILALLLFGSIGLYDLAQAKNKSIRSADLLSDLISRSQDMDLAQAETIFEAALLTMEKYGEESDIKVSMVGWTYEETTDTYEVTWSKGYQSPTTPGGTPLNYNTIAIGTVMTSSSLNFPAIRNGEMLVATELNFDYISPLYWFVEDPFTFISKGVRKPRYVSKLAWVGSY